MHGQAVGVAAEPEQGIIKWMRGLIAEKQKNYGKAERLLQEALSILRKAGTPRDPVALLNWLGDVTKEQHF